MKIEILKWTVCILFLSVLCTVFYFLGRSHAEVKIVKEKGEEIIKEVEVIKYVEKEKAQIWSKPNASVDELIGLFMQNKL